MAENNRAHRVGDVMASVDIAAHPDHPVSEAVERMHDTGMRILPVVDGDEIVGLLRMRDVERDPDAADPAAAVRDEMFAEILYCFADDSVEDAIGLMEKTGFEEYLVVDTEKRLVGHVTLSSLKGEKQPDTERSDPSNGDLAAHRRRGGGRKRGDSPHEVWSFSTRPVIRD